MRVVQRVGDGGHDVSHVGRGHAIGIALAQQPARVGALYVVHRNPDLALEFATVVHTDDVGMPQRGDDIGLAVEPLPILIVRRHRRW